MVPTTPAPPALLTLGKILASVDNLPAMPKVAINVARLIDDPGASAVAIGREIVTDQALTARILKIANSAYYGVSRRISTVQEAVVILGMRTIKTLTIAASMYPAMNREVPGYRIGRGDLWRHSIACAVSAQALAGRLRSREPRMGVVTAEEAFIAGLLHDLGKTALSLYLDNYFEQTHAHALAEGIPFYQAERAVIGLDHARTGAALAEKWNFPASLVDAIACHHDPFTAQHGNIGLACVTHVADAVCVAMGIGIGGDGLLFSLRLEALEALGFSGRIDEVMDICLEALRNRDNAFEFDPIK